MTEVKHIYDVIIVGAGISGLSCSKYLLSQNIDVLVLEARDRVGGRTYTVENERCGYVDHGGAYVRPTQNYVLRLAEELNCPLHKVNEKEDVVCYKNNAQNRFKPLTAPAMSNPFAVCDLINILSKIDNFGKQIPLDAPYVCKNAKKWDNTTMKQFMDQEIWTRECYDLVTLLVHSVIAAEPADVSMLWFLWYVAQGMGVQRMTSVTNSAAHCKILGGAQTLSRKMADLLNLDNRLALDQAVTQIAQDANGTILTTNKGNTYKSRYIILATAPHLQNKITFTPSLPPSRVQLIKELPKGGCIKCHVYYKTAFWRNNGMCGSSTIYDEGAIFGSTVDDTKADGSKPALVGLILGDSIEIYSKLTKDERKQCAAKLLAKVFHNEEALKPIHYEEKNWCEEKWSAGHCISTMGTGVLTSYGKALRAPIGRIYFAGTETATRWTGYMNGAVQAGERAAREVHHAMGHLKAEDIWQDEPTHNSIPPITFHPTLIQRYCPSIPTIIRSAVFTTTVLASVVYAKFFRNES